MRRAVLPLSLMLLLVLTLGGSGVLAEQLPPAGLPPSWSGFADCIAGSFHYVPRRAWGSRSTGNGVGVGRR